jgi:hypothetical protein
MYPPLMNLNSQPETDYPEGSLKAKFCVQGRHLLMDYCTQRGIPVNQRGKLVVATTEQQLPLLDSILAKAHRNGVDDLVKLSQAQAVGSFIPFEKTEDIYLTNYFDVHVYMTNWCARYHTMICILSLVHFFYWVRFQYHFSCQSTNL